MIASVREARPLRRGIVRPHALSFLAFAGGASLAMSFLAGDWGRDVVGSTKLLLVGVLCAALWTGSAASRADSPRLRWLGRVCWVLLVACYLMWAYLGIAFGVLLAWTVPCWLWPVVVLLALAAAATAFRPHGSLQVPMVLPLGIWIAALLSGWLREENLLRCDDFLALQPPAQLAVPNPHVASCRQGEVRPSGRFPRTIWEDPDGKRVVFTTQGAATQDGLRGSVCEARLDGGVPRCVGNPVNKSQGIVDLPDRERLLVMQWGIPTPSGSIGAVVMELPRSEGISILAEHWFDEMVGDGFYEPRNSTLYLFSDRMNGIHRVRLPAFEPLPTIPSTVAPGELRYDRDAGEGVTCGQGLGVAVRGAPFSERHFRESSSSLLDRLSLSWGCDWDEQARKVYSTVPNLGLLDRIDYDSGRVEKRWFVGLGMRSVAYDRARRRVYFTNFLRGDVFAFDESSGRIVERWFVGRFSRWVRLTRDGRALLATGNLGIVRIALEE
jgi:hypothetical protein